MPGVVDTILTPVIILFAMVIINFFVVFTIAGYLFTGIT